jgi:hypothetical protein
MQWSAPPPCRPLDEPGTSQPLLIPCGLTSNTPHFSPQTNPKEHGGGSGIATSPRGVSRQDLPTTDSGSDVVGHMGGSHYRMPSLSSMLPSTSQHDTEYIFRTFNVGNYDLIKTLPTTLKARQVQEARTARQDQARQFLMPRPYQPLVRKDPANQLGLFSTFEYIPSRYSLADELAARDKVESEAKRMAVST